VVFERSRLGRVQDALARRDEWGACEARMPAEASMPADDRHAPLRRRRQRRRRRRDAAERRRDAAVLQAHHISQCAAASTSIPARRLCRSTAAIRSLAWLRPGRVMARNVE